MDACIGRLLATAEPDKRTGCYPFLIDSAFSRSLAPSVIEYYIQVPHNAILDSLLQAFFFLGSRQNFRPTSDSEVLPILDLTLGRLERRQSRPDPAQWHPMPIQKPLGSFLE